MCWAVGQTLLLLVVPGLGAIPGAFPGAIPRVIPRVIPGAFPGAFLGHSRGHSRVTPAVTGSRAEGSPEPSNPLIHHQGDPALPGMCEQRGPAEGELLLTRARSLLSHPGVPGWGMEQGNPSLPPIPTPVPPAQAWWDHWDFSIPASLSTTRVQGVPWAGLEKMGTPDCCWGDTAGVSALPQPCRGDG